MLEKEFLKNLEELVSIGEVVSGSSKEKIVIERLRKEFEKHADEIIVHSIPVASWEEKYSKIIIKNILSSKEVSAIALPYSTSSHIRGKLLHIKNFGFTKTGNIEGKIVLAEWAKDPDEAEHQYLEALEQGALALLLYDRFPSRFRRIVVKGTYGYSFKTCSYTPIPALSLTREDGIKLAKLASKSTVEVEIIVETKTNESSGLNFEAIFNGKSDNEKVYVTAHHDHWLTGVSDNLLGLCFLMYLAENLRKNSLKRELRFLSFTAEEGSGPGSTEWYWLYGSRWYVENIVLKRNMSEEIYAVFNWDAVGKGKLVISASGVAYRRLIREIVGRNVKVEYDSSYFDSYSFSKKGIPAATINTMNDLADIYHTNADVLENLDINIIKESLETSKHIIEGLVEKKVNMNLKYEIEFLRRTLRKIGYVNVKGAYMNPREVIMLYKPIHRGNYREEYNPFETYFIPEITIPYKYLKLLLKLSFSIKIGDKRKALKIISKIPSEVMMPGEEKAIPIAPVRTIKALVRNEMYSEALAVIDSSIALLRKNIGKGVKETIVKR